MRFLTAAGSRTGSITLSWWKEELASEEEMEEGRNNLAAHDNRNVDEKKILLYEQIIRVV